eukprot:5724325-Karenia_brevis.AAC.1
MSHNVSPPIDSASFIVHGSICVTRHPVPSAVLRHPTLQHKKSCDGPLGDCGANARIGRPV